MWFLGGRYQWDDRSRDVARAVQLDRARRCPGCGTSKSDWFDANGDELHEPPLGVKVEHCPGCAMKAREEEGLRERKDSAGEYVVFTDARSATAAHMAASEH